MIRLRFRLIAPSILSSIIFPPFGMGGLICLIAGFIFHHYGRTREAKYSFEISNHMILWSVYCFLALMLIGSFVVFWVGGNFISVIGSFY